MEVNMALKKTSEPIQISAIVTEGGANTFTEAEIQLDLSPLNNEVLLIHAVDMAVGSPDVVGGTDTSTLGSLSTTTRTAIGTISSSNVIAAAGKAIRDGVVPFSSMSPETPTGNMLDYIGICATSNMFLQVQGANNAGAKSVEARIYCTRAKADAATYAALVQSEVLSS